MPHSFPESLAWIFRVIGKIVESPAMIPQHELDTSAGPCIHDAPKDPARP